MYVCMYLRTYVCMYVYMYICMYVCMYIHTCINPVGAKPSRISQMHTHMLIYIKLIRT